MISSIKDSPCLLTLRGIILCLQIDEIVKRRRTKREDWITGMIRRRDHRRQYLSHVYLWPMRFKTLTSTHVTWSVSSAPMNESAGEILCLEKSTTHVYTSHGGKLEGRSAGEELDPRTL